jgi:peptide/nickel transport system permease protein
MEQYNEKELRKKLRREALRKNWKLFKESKLGMVGLYIVVFFFILTILQPLLFITGIWNKGIYDPVVGYDSIKENLLVVDCPKASEYPTEKYESYLDCPGEGEINRKTILNQPTLKAGDYYEAFVQPAPPSRKHFLGTDSLGRDVFSQIMEGSQVAFVLGLLSATLGVGISTILGTIAAFFGGRIDAYLMRQSDLILMLPTLPLLFIISAFAELKVWHLAVVLGVLGGLGGSVITIKSQALQVKVKPFVDSARVTGGSNMKILFSHVLPNVAPLALLFMVFSVTGAIASESVLSFLGLLNIDMSWGIMIYIAQTDGFIFSGLRYWWLILPAGLAVTLLAGGFYLVGRGLDDVFNPRLRKR